MTIRQDLKKTIQTTLQNTVGVGKVFTHRPKVMVQTDFPSIVINFPHTAEHRASANAPIGKKHIEFTAQLECATIDVSNDGSGQDEFDAFLDAIDDQLRKDPTLGGTVLSAAVKEINTVTTTPQLVNGQNIALLAIKEFDVTIQVTG